MEDEEFNPYLGVGSYCDHYCLLVRAKRLDGTPYASFTAGIMRSDLAPAIQEKIGEIGMTRVRIQVRSGTNPEILDQLAEELPDSVIA